MTMDRGFPAFRARGHAPAPRDAAEASFARGTARHDAAAASDEPATRHFTPAELDSFLQEIELAHPPRHSDSGLLLRPTTAPRPTGALLQSSDGDRRPRPRTRASNTHVRVLGLPGLALFACAGSLAALWGFSALRSSAAPTVRAARMLMPPPLPVPPAALGARSQVARSQACDVPSAQLGEARPSPAGPSLAGPSLVSPALAVAPLDDTRRREAVELLLSGRTREALDAYRALSPSLHTHAVEGVVRYLARELETCRDRAGTSCGSH